MSQNKAPLSKAERRELARREAERIAAKQAASDKRSRSILITIVLALVVALGVAGFFIWKESQKTLLADFTGAVPAGTDMHGGIPFGKGAVAGTTTDGKPTLDIYFDFMCPACGTFEKTNGEDVTAMLESGDVTVVYHPLGFLDRFSQGTEYSTRAASAFLTVAAEEPDKAQAFLSALFANQPAENSTGLDDAKIKELALGAGVSEQVAGTLAEGKYKDWVGVASQQATRDGVGGTPTVKLNGKTQGKTELNWTNPGELKQLVTSAK